MGLKHEQTRSKTKTFIFHLGLPYLRNYCVDLNLITFVSYITFNLCNLYIIKPTDNIQIRVSLQIVRILMLLLEIHE